MVTSSAFFASKSYALASNGRVSNNVERNSFFMMFVVLIDDYFAKVENNLETTKYSPGFVGFAIQLY